jgi:hypothetical protein
MAANIEIRQKDTVILNGGEPYAWGANPDNPYVINHGIRQFEDGRLVNRCDIDFGPGIGLVHIVTNEKATTVHQLPEQDIYSGDSHHQRKIIILNPDMNMQTRNRIESGAIVVTEMVEGMQYILAVITHQKPETPAQPTQN